MKMKLIVILFFVSAVTVFAGNSQKEKEKRDFIDDITVSIKNAVDDLADTTIPIIQSESKKIWKEVEEQVDKGILNLDALTDDVDKIVAELEEKLSKSVSSNDLVTITAALDLISGKAVMEVVDGLSDIALKKIGLPIDKIDQVDTILSKDIKERGELLDKYLDKGKGGLAEFQVENEKVFDATAEELKGILTEKELKALEKWFDKTGKKMDKLIKKKK